MENLYLFNLESGEYAATMPYNDEIVPENGTLKKVPKINTNEAAVFNKDLNKWEIKADYRFTHRMIDSENNLKYITEIGEIPEGYTLVTNEEAKEIEARMKIEKLTMTRLDFINFLKKCGLTLEQIYAYLDLNLELKTELNYCSEVYCCRAKAIMPIKIDEITITAAMVEAEFIEKNKDLFIEQEAIA